jgi:hypothetical protein
MEIVKYVFSNSYPVEIWKIIISYLEDDNVINVGFINKQLYNIIKNNNFWISRETSYSFAKFNIHNMIKRFMKIYTCIKNNAKDNNNKTNKKNNNKKLLYSNDIKYSHSTTIKKNIYMLLCSNEFTNNNKLEKYQTTYEFNETEMIDKIVKNENYGDDDSYYYHTTIYYDTCILIECVLNFACGRIGIYIVNPYLNTYHTLITNNYVCCREGDDKYCTSCVIYGNYVWYTLKI